MSKLLVFLLSLALSMQSNRIQDSRLDDVVWQLSHVDGAPVSTIPEQLTLRFDSLTYSFNYFGGTLICNYYVGRYDSAITGTLTVTTWSPTLALCSSEKDNFMENEFRSRIQKMSIYTVEVSGNRKNLYLYDLNNTELLRFTKLNKVSLPIVRR